MHANLWLSFLLSKQARAVSSSLKLVLSLHRSYELWVVGEGPQGGLHAGVAKPLIERVILFRENDQ